jgi:phosphate:Na+ symporter
VSGVLMVALSAVESLLGVPLIRAAVTAVGTDIKMQLALVFLLSNLMPAVAISPFLGPCRALLARLWPATTIEDAAKPKYLTTQALDDPNTALDLVGREIASLVGNLRQLITPNGLAKNETEQLQALTELSDTITAFISSLASAPLSPASASRLGIFREELVIVSYLAEGMHNLGQTLGSLASIPGESGYFHRLVEAVGQLLHTAAHAADALDAGGIGQLREESRGHGPLVQEVHQFCLAQSETAPASEKATLLKAANQFELLAWILHRLAKVLAELVPHTLFASSPVPGQ